MNILATIKTDAAKVLHFVEEPVEEAGKLGSLIATGFKVAPLLAAETKQLVALGEAVVGDGAAALGDKGLAFTLDVQTFQAAQAFFAYFSGTYLPAWKSAIAEAEGDVSSSAAPATSGVTGSVAPEKPAPVPVAAAAAKGPGLSQVVPA